jgi:hypothetical protein
MEDLKVIIGFLQNNLFKQRHFYTFAFKFIGLTKCRYGFSSFLVIIHNSMRRSSHMIKALRLWVAHSIFQSDI